MRNLPLLRKHPKNLHLVVLSALVAVALAAPQQQPYTTPIPIIRLQNDASPDGTYQFSYETGNGIVAQEQGQLKNVGTQDEANSVVGSFSYTGPDSVQYSVQYTADDNGFLAQGAHLPTPPPIPAELAKALEAAARLPDPNDGGQYQPNLYGNNGR
ncbi:Endocuticle structural glycoprotein SgAbd-2 [Frankliniella fusca]|uniref:Endocuticle structural glycoprotein SgAbd-2 n=1 Tax=Frankliniella fusca TaxID=407009 RepID=A0AAE1LTR1_9NEOP|nr:Endocuticle structural glycoprotein SgAbd-2 [Frankliniella fusca]